MLAVKIRIRCRVLLRLISRFTASDLGLYCLPVSYTKGHKILMSLSKKHVQNQILQLCTAGTVWFDPVIRAVSVFSGKFTTPMVTNEKQRNAYLTNN